MASSIGLYCYTVLRTTVHLIHHRAECDPPVSETYPHRREFAILSVRFASYCRVLLLNPFTPKSYKLHIPPAASPEITSRSMKNLAFHSLLRWKMIVLPTPTPSLIHFSLMRLGECTFFERGSERNAFSTVMFRQGVGGDRMSSEVILAKCNTN